jgi:prevent-host-death family protein
MSYVNLAEVKAHLSEYVQRVTEKGERIMVTVRGEPTAVLMSRDELESLEETLDIMNDPELVADIIAAKAEIAAGKSHTIDEVEARLRERLERERLERERTGGTT